MSDLQEEQHFQHQKLCCAGASIVVNDNKIDSGKTKLVKELETYGPVESVLGSQDPSLLDDYTIDIVIPSPGVPLTIPLIKEARKRGLEIIGDIELFYRYHPGSRYVGITGTDGKTTTTTLVYNIIKKEKHALLGGNVGIPVFDYDGEAGDDSILVLELSSFQLETIDTFRPDIAAVLNLAEDHLDRYGSMESYLESKKRIFSNQIENDTAILNLDSPYCSEFSRGIKPGIQYFSSKKKADIYLNEDTIFYKDEKYIDRKNILLKGAHNAENAMAAILISKALGISDESIKTVLSEFSGLPHRLELVRKLNGVEYYNDSKATTVNSLEKALLSFERPVILIAGGRDKGLDFTRIKGLASKKLKELIVIGEAAEKIKNELGFPLTSKSISLKDAVTYAQSRAAEGDIILLSPGCASFDMFKDYEERGDVFREIVSGLEPVHF